MPEAQQAIGEFYADVVLPALVADLDAAFPEFGWRRDGRGWVATNQEMTHRVLGVRADRVVAHGDAPPGFLVHGGESVLWTAYLNGGDVPRGDNFRSVVRDLASRAGVDASSVDLPRPLDRRREILSDFYRLCRGELCGSRGGPARAYLQNRGFPERSFGGVDLGVVPDEQFTTNALKAAGYSELEIARSGVVADGRWPGRLCGAWRDERGEIGTIWTRLHSDSEREPRYLYLRGASRSALPPYGLSDVVRLPAPERREIVLVEGLMDVHHLRARGFAPIAGVGGTRLQSSVVKFSQLGFESVVLAFDNDSAGRDGLTRAVDELSRSRVGPAVRVIEPRLLGQAKDPDAFVGTHGVKRFQELVTSSECAVAWRAVDLVGDVSQRDLQSARRAALGRAGAWLGSLPARLALEQEDAVGRVADRCGYSRAAVERAFHARYWGVHERPRRPVIER